MPVFWIFCGNDLSGLGKETRGSWLAVPGSSSQTRKIAFPQLKKLSNKRSFIYLIALFTIYGYITNCESAQLSDGLIAQLGKNCTFEVMVGAPFTADFFQS